MTLRRTAFPLCFLALCLLALTSTSLGQTETATLSGLITDPQGRVVPDVAVDVTNVDTNVSVHQTTNGAGLYVVVGLKPGRYRVSVTKEGFRRIDLTDLVLNVQDVLSRNFQLQLGPVLASITVVADEANVNTESATVSTVIDRNFAENLPLNGRSFNTLLQLTPGVVIAAANGNNTLTGFSVAGQRTESNNFLVDGMSANFGVLPTPIATNSGTGTAQAFSALGGTSSLVSVEALQEFRVETSSFAPEFGRSSGGQVILTTRGGTNSSHGGAYEYFRNDVLDANDWFANQAASPRPVERHNDFGGYLGGPIWKDKTFFFASYEGARLRLPQTSVVSVPSLAARQSAPAAVAPILNAYPLPNGPVSPGGNTAQFTGAFSNQATLNAGSIRLDHTFSPRFSIFGRYNEAPSQLVQSVGGLSTLESTEVNTRTLTIGMNMNISSRLSNTLRGNYSKQQASSVFSLDNFAGAVPADPSLFLGSLSSASNSFQFQTGDSSYIDNGPSARNHTKQLDFVDDLALTIGRHQLKFGGGYRAVFLDLAPARNEAFYSASTVQGFLSTSQADLFIATLVPSRVLSQSVSVYGQDTWKISARATLTYGLRWELSPAPTALGNTTLAAWTNVNTPANIALAPKGSPIWDTTYGNFAPRIGFAYRLTDSGDLVLRAGAGIFYDLAVGAAAAVAASFPNLASTFNPGVPLPVSDMTPFLPVISLQPPYPDGIQAFDPNLKLPRSYQWNVALEKSFGGKQAISVTYVAQAGRDLLRQAAFSQPNLNFSGAFLLTGNDARSNYNAAQLQYRRRLSRGLQALLNYTWSHSLDNASNDVVAGLSSTVISAAHDYGQSSFDVRHSFSAAFTYAIPAAAKSGPLSLLTKDWFLDTIIVARGGFPFNGLVYLASPGPLGYALSRPDLVQGKPLWIANSNAAGGKSLNPDAFSVPSPPRQGTEGRNDISGFGLTQADLSFGRKFPITERLNLQFRADAFNVLNHPNFSNPEGLVEFGPFFLKSLSMLNQGLGGLNPLFQEGGPRSLQLSLKLTF
jgi:hypothetical protein